MWPSTWSVCSTTMEQCCFLRTKYVCIHCTVPLRSSKVKQCRCPVCHSGDQEHPMPLTHPAVPLGRKSSLPNTLIPKYHNTQIPWWPNDGNNSIPKYPIPQSSNTLIPLYSNTWYHTGNCKISDVRRYQRMFQPNSQVLTSSRPPTSRSTHYVQTKRISFMSLHLPENCPLEWVQLHRLVFGGWYVQIYCISLLTKHRFLCLALASFCSC